MACIIWSKQAADRSRPPAQERGETRRTPTSFGRSWAQTPFSSGEEQGLRSRHIKRLVSAARASGGTMFHRDTSQMFPQGCLLL